MFCADLNLFKDTRYTIYSLGISPTTVVGLAIGLSLPSPYYYNNMRERCANSSKIESELEHWIGFENRIQEERYLDLSKFDLGSEGQIFKKKYLD